MILQKLRSALSSVILKIFLAAAFILQAMVLTGGSWCGFHRVCPPEFFLTRVDASLCALFGTFFLFMAAKQVLRGLLRQLPLAYDGETTAPFEINPDDEIYVDIHLPPRNELPVTSPGWWIQPGPDA